MMQKCHIYFIGLWLTICCFACDVFCETPAGTVISNFATATFYDTELGVGGSVDSNVGTIIVKAVYALQLLDDRSKKGVPGGFINFPHIIKNTGNSEDSYEIKVSNLQGDDFDSELIQIIFDKNTNGQIDPGESAISQTNVIQPDDFIHLVIGISIPGGVNNGSSANWVVSAQSISDKMVSDDNFDSVTITMDALISIGITNNPNCDQYVESKETIYFSVAFSNIGLADPQERDVSILKNDITSLQKGVLLESNIPPNTFLSSVKDINYAPVSALLLLKPISSPTNTWILFEDWNGQDMIEKIGLLMINKSLSSNHSGLLSFYLEVAENITNGIIITTIAGIDLDGDSIYDFQSNETCNRIRSHDTAQLNFIDSNLNYVQSYQLESSPKYHPEKDDVYVEVKSSSFNRFVNEKEVIQATVESKETADSVMLNLYETDINTGLFRSRTPIILVDREQKRRRSSRFCQDGSPCYLSSKPIDSLVSIIDDPVEGELRDLAAIEPFGHVFDSITFQPVEGVEVFIHRIDNEQPTDTKGNPIVQEITNREGRFQFTDLAPYDGYYFSVVPPNVNYVFPSQKPASMLLYAWPDVNQISYGIDGYKNQVPSSGVFSIGSSKRALQVDIPLDPYTSGEMLAITKTTNETYSYIGGTVTYEVKLKNLTHAVLIDTKLYDWIPEGFEYEISSTFINGNIAKDPVSGGENSYQYENRSPDLVFNIGKIDNNQEIVIRYSLTITENASVGLNQNIAQAEASSGGAAIVRSNLSPAEIDIRQGLILQKSTRQHAVNIKNHARYTVRLTNRSESNLKDSEIIDIIPKGFEYVSGSSYLDGQLIKDPTLQFTALNNNAMLIFQAGNLDINQEKILTYHLNVTAEALQGDGNNIAKQ